MEERGRQSAAKLTRVRWRTLLPAYDSIGWGERSIVGNRIEDYRRHSRAMLRAFQFNLLWVYFYLILGFLSI